MMTNRTLQDQVLSHEYDGIREFDNPTPGWWNWLFALSVMFSVVYWAWYHVGTQSSTLHDNWESAQVAEFQKIFSGIGKLEADEPTLRRMMGDPQMMAVARGIFAGNCAACHARDGGGITGPNLTDDAYKNVRALGDFFTVVTRGANNGAMPAWENRLSANERIILAAFAATLRGTTPANPKAPEGDLRPASWSTAEGTANGSS